MSINLGILASSRSSAGGGTDADAQAFFNRVIAAGGTLTSTEQTAVNTLVISLKAVGVWTLMKAIYPMVGASAAACAQNLKSSSFTGTFNGTWVFSSNGITSNGTNAYFNTTLSPVVSLTNYNAHASVYNRLIGNNSGFDLGITNGNSGFNNEFLLASYRGSKSIGAFYNYTSFNSSSEVIVTSSSGQGFFNHSIISNTSQTLYKNGANIISTVLLNTSTPSNFPIYLGAVNNYNSTAIEYTANQYAFCTIGDGLSNAQASNFYTSVQAFQTSLNRQV